MKNLTVKAKCRRCGREAPAEQFVLHHQYRMMVCPECVKEGKQHTNVHYELRKQKELEAKQKPDEKPKPAGWDADDEYLERAARQQSKEPKAEIERISKDMIRYKCQKCSYRFTYNTEKKIPARCPYCSREIQLT